MGYLHIQIIREQLSKRNGKVCGDVLEMVRTDIATTQIICDGLGSGIKANLAATLCASRIKQLLSSGFSLRQTFLKVLKTMEHAKRNELPYAVFSIAQILNDGITTILSYEMPPPIFVTQRYSSLLDQKSIEVDNCCYYETSCFLKKGEGVLLISDGVSYAGIGKRLKQGWGIEGINRFITEALKNGALINDIPNLIGKNAKKLWADSPEDDCTIVLAKNSRGTVINIMTGPPVKKENDLKIVSKFLSKEGIKIVCGATTAKMVAKVMGEELEMSSSYNSTIAPPNYEIEGIDLVTEGSVTLNQLYNIWDEDSTKFEKNSPVTELYDLLTGADRVNIFVGNAYNEANDDISFAQTGILKRSKIIPLLIANLEKDGKLVYLENH